jgi:hypothetical protein
MFFEPFATAPGHLKDCDTPQSEVSMRAMMEVEDIFSVCCEFWLEKQQEFNSY